MKLFIGAGLEAGSSRGRGPRGPGAAPAPIRDPALSGTGRIGEPLSVDPGTWARAAGFGFAWLRGGAAIPGATAAVYAPTPADDRAVLACRVTAVNAAGTTARETRGLTITFAPPHLVGILPDIDYTPSTGPRTVDLSSFFSGSSLRFDVSGEGVSIDPAAGVLTISAASLSSGVSVVVTAANSGGVAEASFRLKVTPPPAVDRPPVCETAPALIGSGRVGETLTVDPGVWTGEPAPALAPQWLKDGAPIPGATGLGFTPGAAEDGAPVACRIVARNAAGEAEATTAAVRVSRPAPAARGAIPNAVFAQGPGSRTIEGAAAFSGDALRFSVAGAGAAVDPETGVVTIPTDTLRAGEVVALTAANSGGDAQQRFSVTVMAAPSAVGTPAAVVYPLGAGSRTVAAKGFFAGADLVFALEAAPAGATIDAATGIVTIPTAAALAGEVAVRATNAVGAASQRFAVKVMAAPAAAGAVGAVVYPQGAGSRTLAAKGLFTGPDLVFSLVSPPAGASIDAASGLVTLSTATAREQVLRVRAANAVGAATLSFPLAVLAAPVAAGTPEPVVFKQDPGVRTISAQAFFGGSDLVYSLDPAAPAGVTINPGSGLVSVATDRALQGTIVVRAANPAGAATQSLSLSVRAMAQPPAVTTPPAPQGGDWALDQVMVWK